MHKITIFEIPPSNNKFIGRGSNYTQRIEYQEQKRHWEWLINAAARNYTGESLKKAVVKITYYFKDNRRRDPDNYSGKFILDGLVKAGIIEDDSFKHIKLVLDGKCDKDNPRTEIEITKLY